MCVPAPETSCVCSNKKVSTRVQSPNAQLVWTHVKSLNKPGWEQAGPLPTHFAAFFCYRGKNGDRARDVINRNFWISGFMTFLYLQISVYNYIYIHIYTVYYYFKHNILDVGVRAAVY